MIVIQREHLKTGKFRNRAGFFGIILRQSVASSLIRDVIKQRGGSMKTVKIHGVVANMWCFSLREDAA